MVVFLFWLVIGVVIDGVIGGMIGSGKGKVGLGVFIGAFFGPIGWIIILLIKGDYICPACKGNYKPGASKCIHCGHDLTEQNVAKSDETKSDETIKKVVEINQNCNYKLPIRLDQ
jgi:hypothetical protein